MPRLLDVHLRPAAPPSLRSDRDETAGFTVTEMLVAMMLLTIGALALYQSMTASNVLAENAERHSTATRLAASEIEKARIFPYGAVAMDLASAGTTYFEGAQQVTDAVDGRVTPSTSVVVDGITFEIRRYVTWRSATVNGANVDQAFKQLTVIVSWTDMRGTHDVRSASAIARTTPAPENLALLGTASMSSNWSPSLLLASNLNNGRTDGWWDNTAASDLGHTANQRNPWAALELPATATIDTISIWNRADCCASRATNVWIFVSATPIANDLATAKSSSVQQFNIPGQIGRPSTVDIRRTGRYVKIFIEGTTYLNLAEIEIFGVQS